MAAKQFNSPRESLPAVQCSFAMCQSPAMMRVRTKTGWANVCDPHDVELKTREAKEWLKEEGIDRQPGESMREWVTRTMLHMRNRPRTRLRIPGLSGAFVGDLLPAIRVPGPEEPADFAFAGWNEAPATEQELDALT